MYKPSRSSQHAADTAICRRRTQKNKSRRHLVCCLARCDHPSIASDYLLLALNAVWPSRKDQVLGAAGIYASGGGLVRELYRGYIRSSSLGRDNSPGSILDPTNADAWPPLIFLTDFDNQMLLTMGDDEFFGTTTSVLHPEIL